MSVVEDRLAELGLTVPDVAMPVAAYLPAVRDGNLIYTSGQLPMVSGALAATGKVGEGPGLVSVEDAKELAQVCALNAIAAVKALVGDLDMVTRVVKVVGFVVGDVSGTEWRAGREALLSRELSLAQMLIGRGLVLRSDLLQARAHWITPEFEPKRYYTRFFAALLPAGQIADDQTSEADHADWANPVRLLEDYANGYALMLPPTVVCLEQVAAAPCVAEFLAAEVQMAPVTPVLLQTDDAVVIRCVLPTRHLPMAGE